MANEETLLVFREYNEQTDRSFLMSSWINKMSNEGTMLQCQSEENDREGLNFARRNAVYQLWLEKLLKRDTIKIVVLCNSSYGNQIVGAIVYEQDKDKSAVCLHWVYVKELYQKNGFGSQMISLATTGMKKFSYTFQTKTALKLIRNHKAEQLIDWVPQKIFSNHGCFKSREEEIRLDAENSIKEKKHEV